jgi:Fic family protein
MLELLPVPKIIDLETPAILKQAIRANRWLGELKGAVKAIPNDGILIDALSLQEAKDSSAIENIITTQDDLYRADPDSEKYDSLAAKEVHHYADALKLGFGRVRRQGFIRLADILDIQEILERNKAGLRRVPGTNLKNEQTGEVIYEPPQDPAEIVRLMDNLVAYVNRDEPNDPDALIRMAVMHYQFESIHPFHDGNGRTGRIMNILYLVLHGLIDLPVLYLSRYIVRHKQDYYKGLQNVRDRGAWEEWVLYMLVAVEETARATLEKVHGIRDQMQDMKRRLRKNHGHLYSQDLLNNLFRHPYTKISFLMRDLGKSRPTVVKYLEELSAAGILRKMKLGTTNFYVNDPLFTLLGQ